MYKVLAITGYKPHEIGIFNEKHEHLPFLKMAIKKKILHFKEEFDIEWVLTSGQPGVELWAAEAVLELKHKYQDLKLATLAPFHNQEERFSEPIKTLYSTVWEQSDYKDFITKRPYDNPAQLRMKNQFIIDKSDAFLVLYDEATEGTPKFYLSYAQQKHETENYPIFYLTPDDIEEIIRDELDNESQN